MEAFLVERLTPTGWKRPKAIHYRLDLAIRDANFELTELASNVRILPVSIGDSPVWEGESASDKSNATDGEALA